MQTAAPLPGAAAPLQWQHGAARRSSHLHPQPLSDVAELGMIARVVLRCWRAEKRTASAPDQLFACQVRPSASLRACAA